MRPALASARRVGLIGWNEFRRTRGSFDRKSTIVLFVIALAGALLTPRLLDQGFDFEHSLYRVASSPDAVLLPAAQASPLFAIVVTHDPRSMLAAGDVDLALEGTRVFADDNAKGNSGVAALRQAARDWTFALMSAEDDAAAAFPVRVELVYAPQERAGSGAAPGLAAGGEFPGPDEGGDGGIEGGATGGAGSAGAAGAAPVAQPGPSSGFSLLPPERSVNTPETLSPPFPFRSLILAYLFLIPMNFVVQVYAGSAIAERLGRKGEALLASPARPWEIVAGKALPYFASMMIVSAAIAIGIGGGWLSILAVAPLVLAFLALEFVAAMFARSFRELTFLTVFTSVMLTIYAFLPAVFSDVHPVSLVSPITLVVFDLRAEPVTLGQILYATMPLTLVSGVLFFLGTMLYREEDLFHQKPVLQKAVDALARPIRSLKSAIPTQALLMPFVFVAELLLVAFLFAWPVPVGVLGVLVAVAVVEETFKGLPSYAAVARGAITPKRAVAFGALAGFGFFLAEKGFLLASLVGLFDVPAGAAVFNAAAPSLDGASWGLVALLLLAPLALHVVTASVSAYGAARGKRSFGLAFLGAVAIHTAYNWTIVTAFGGLGG